MQYNVLGNTGLKVSRLCLGAMTFGSGFQGIGEVGQDLANRMVARALDDLVRQGKVRYVGCSNLAVRHIMKANALDEMAEDKGSTIPRLALGWLLEQQGVSSVIIGAKKMDQLEDNLGAVNVSFTEDELERLDELTKPTPQYPQWMIQFQNQREDR